MTGDNNFHVAVLPGDGELVPFEAGGTHGLKDVANKVWENLNAQGRLYNSHSCNDFAGPNFPC